MTKQNNSINKKSRVHTNNQKIIAKKEGSINIPKSIAKINWERKRERVNLKLHFSLTCMLLTVRSNFFTHYVLKNCDFDPLYKKWIIIP